MNLKVRKSEFAVIRGPSGAGKTTLLNIISGIDKPTSEEIVVFRHDLNSKNEEQSLRPL